MKRLRSVLSPMVTAAGILGFSGVSLAQSPSESHRAASARAHEIMSSAPCPLPKVTKDKITEEQARDLAQAFADKNMGGYRVVRPLGYGGGYTTMCYRTSQTVAVQSSSAPTGNRNADRDAAEDRVERERRLKGLAPVIGSKTADRDSAEDRIERERRNPLSSATPAKTGTGSTDSNTTVGRDTDQPNQSRSGNAQTSTTANRNIGSTAAVKGADQQMTNASTARPLVLYSVEYSIDLKNAAGDTRNLCVDQFGTVSEFCSDFGFAGRSRSDGSRWPHGSAGSSRSGGATSPC